MFRPQSYLGTALIGKHREEELWRALANSSLYLFPRSQIIPKEAGRVARKMPTRLGLAKRWRQTNDRKDGSCLSGCFAACGDGDRHHACGGGLIVMRWDDLLEKFFAGEGGSEYIWEVSGIRWLVFRG